MPNNGWQYYRRPDRKQNFLQQTLSGLLYKLNGLHPTNLEEKQPPPELKQEDWGNGSVTNNTYNYNAPDVKNYNNYETNNNYSRNNTYYYSSTTIQNITIIDPTIPPKVEKPPSKLPLENLEQTATGTTKIEPISIAKALEEKEYGRLLASPFSQQEIKLRRANDAKFNAEFEAAKQSGLEKFLAYHLDEKTENLLDSICLAVPEFGRGFYGKMSLTFGADSLRLYGNYLGASSLNALMGVNDTIPKKYKTIDYNPPFSDEKVEIKDFVLDINSDNIRKLILGNTDGQEINWGGWLKEAIDNQLDENGKQQEIPIQDLAQLIRNNLANLYYRLGLHEYPIEVPETLNQDIEAGDDKEEITKEINNLTAYQVWLIQALDSVLGQFPIKIRIEDNDLIKTGNQSIDIALPNLAETISELLGKSITQQATIDALLNTSLRNLAETGLTKQIAIQNHYLGLANQEYLGYQIEQKTEEVDFLFNPKIVESDKAEQNLDKALENSKVKVPIVDNVERDTLEKQLQQLLQAAAIIRAVHYRSFDAKSDIGEQFKNIIQNARGLSDNFSNLSQEDLQEFFDSLEQGFSDKSDSMNPNKPYGNEYENRPKIKKLS